MVSSRLGAKIRTRELKIHYGSTGGGIEGEKDEKREYAEQAGTEGKERLD